MDDDIEKESNTFFTYRKKQYHLQKLNKKIKNDELKIEIQRLKKERLKNKLEQKDKELWKLLQKASQIDNNADKT